MAILPKAIYRLNSVPIKISKSFFHRNRQMNYKIHMEVKSHPKAKAILSKNSNAIDITTPDFKLY
jgi:hypothetical protein